MIIHKGSIKKCVVTGELKWFVLHWHRLIDIRKQNVEHFQSNKQSLVSISRDADKKHDCMLKVAHLIDNKTDPEVVEKVC